MSACLGENVSRNENETLTDLSQHLGASSPYKDVVAVASFLTLQVAVFDRGKLDLPELMAPFMSITQLNLMKDEEGGDKDSSRSQNGLINLQFSVPSIVFNASPYQTEVRKRLHHLFHLMGKIPLRLNHL